MSRRIMISLAAAALLGASFVSISSDASARVYRGARVGVAHGAAYRGAVVRRGVGIGVGAAAVRAAAYGSCRVRQCGPYGACSWVYTC
jgi:carbonic anhydrase/acetyltransferase-like protein (isoleucine patch superfamily)